MTQYQFISTWVDSHQEMVKKIKDTAAKIHAEVNQMYDGDKPYSVHLFAVLDNVICSSGDMYPVSDIPAIIFGACFHDSIEDARLTYNDVKKIAHELVPEMNEVLAADIVYALTNEKGKTRAERANWKYYRGIRMTPYARMIKMADRLANMDYGGQKKSSMSTKYAKEWPHFKRSLFEYPLMGIAYRIPKAMIVHMNLLLLSM